jgi:hypothetical protein
MADSPGLTSHGFLFGTKVEDTVAWIMDEAARIGTAKAYQEASFELKGIERFLQMMDLSIAAMMISNDRVKIDQVLDMLGAERAYIR